jgi:hypothetical protein
LPAERKAAEHARSTRPQTMRAKPLREDGISPS